MQLSLIDFSERLLTGLAVLSGSGQQYALIHDGNKNALLEEQDEYISAMRIPSMFMMKLRLNCILHICILNNKQIEHIPLVVPIRFLK